MTRFDDDLARGRFDKYITVAAALLAAVAAAVAVAGSLAAFAFGWFALFLAWFLIGRRRFGPPEGKRVDPPRIHAPSWWPLVPAVIGAPIAFGLLRYGSDHNNPDLLSLGVLVALAVGLSILFSILAVLNAGPPADS